MCSYLLYYDIRNEARETHEDPQCLPACLPAYVRATLKVVGE